MTQLMIVPVPVSVHVPDPITVARAIPLVDVQLAIETLCPFALNVPLAIV